MVLLKIKVDVIEVWFVVLLLFVGVDVVCQVVLVWVIKMGLLIKCDEYWCYIDLLLLMVVDVFKVVVFYVDEVLVFGEIDCVKIVFVDGVFDVDVFDDLSFEGVEVLCFVDVFVVDIYWVIDFYGMFEVNGQVLVECLFVVLNMVFVIDGVVIYVMGKVVKLIYIVYVYNDDVLDVILYYLIKVDVGVEVIVLESGFVVLCFFCVIEVDIVDIGILYYVCI